MVARRELPSKMFSGRSESALHFENWREASFDAKPGGKNKMQVWGSGFRVWVDNRVRSGVCVFDLWCAQSSPYFACGQNMAGNEDIGSDPLDKLMLHQAVNKRWLCLFCVSLCRQHKCEQELAVFWTGPHCYTCAPSFPRPGLFHTNKRCLRPQVPRHRMRV